VSLLVICSSLDYHTHFQMQFGDEEIFLDLADILSIGGMSKHSNQTIDIIRDYQMKGAI